MIAAAGVRSLPELSDGTLSALAHETLLKLYSHDHETLTALAPSTRPDTQTKPFQHSLAQLLQTHLQVSRSTFPIPPIFLFCVLGWWGGGVFHTRF
jgi:hypothetical protein